MFYRLLDRLAPSPTVALNLAIALGMAHGPSAGLEALRPLLSGLTNSATTASTRRTPTSSN